MNSAVMLRWVTLRSNTTPCVRDDLAIQGTKCQTQSNEHWRNWYISFPLLSINNVPSEIINFSVICSKRGSLHRWEDSVGETSSFEKPVNNKIFGALWITAERIIVPLTPCLMTPASKNGTNYVGCIDTMAAETVQGIGIMQWSVKLYHDIPK